ncbi:MAG: HlyD family efflux transporter periplasmic adaptor subunit [Flavobacteriaceae bacterium]|nr:HlyD family efflux transporter periplasmic adaptor subunit [Flavobacteriaceae bacterium]MCB0484889.1 HlyD family efflux transporter periplasmic adaptor subunit [Flavobacteriaceae bacterium]
MRKFIIIILGLLLVVGAIALASFLIKSNKPKVPTIPKIVKTVSVDTVINKEIPIIITTSGNLVAKNKIELYSEVQGVLQASRKEFKAGTNYYKGETLLHINSDEFYASLQSQKSNFYNLIASVIPDIRLDYPENYQKWENYLQSFDINKATPKLPEFSSDKEKYFITGRGITTAYYNIKNLEVKLGKHAIKAPYNGVLTEALVTPGTLVRVGQKLGEFINPSVYEMEVAINAAYSDLLKIGNTVTLYDLERLHSYKGKVIRVNGKVDQTSQTTKAYIQVSHPDLKEGMYLEADLVAKSESNAYEISRKQLVDNKGVFVVKDSVLDLVEIKPVYSNAESVVIKGLPDHTLILSQIVPGSYDGMPVKIISNK